MLGAVGLLLVMGAVYQHISETRDFMRYPPPGQLVEAGGFRLHLHCEGAGYPTVVVEAGGGDYSLSWRVVQIEVSQQSRICTYDRAGLGWSDFDQQAPTRDRVVQNLRTVLHNAGVEEPYVLVGHSVGGVYVREFATRHRADVAGLVFVDSSHENQMRRDPVDEDPLRARLRLCKLLAPVGIVRALGLVNAYVPTQMPENIRSMRIAALNRTHSCAATLNARLSFFSDLNQEEAPSTLDDLPLIVLTRGQDADELWRSNQTELAGLSTNSDHRIVEGAGHYIHRDRPEAVVEAIRDVLMMASE